MFALAVAVAATVLLTRPGYAQETDNTHRYTVWSSVVFSRTGERTPEILATLPTQLTSLGAHQEYDAGAFFRQRYLRSGGSNNGIDNAPIHGMNANELDNDQLYVMALDLQYNLASAQAFLQGLYPPYSLGGNESSAFMKPESILANGSYIEGPMDGYQYPQIRTADAYDIEFPYLGGQIGCTAWGTAAANYFHTPEFLQTQAISSGFYDVIGTALLGGVLDESAWDYWNAYAIYDYVSYQNTHNATVADVLAQDSFVNSATNVSYLDTLRWLANEQQYAWYGNTTAYNNYTESDSLPGGAEGSISTIAGNMLAAKMLSMLQVAVSWQGESHKLNLLFGDYQPLLSLFALLDLPTLNSHFYGLPNFGSAAAFELFSYTSDETGTDFPSEDDLWVRFLFRNGTNADEPFQAYSIFNNGPSHMDIPWIQFQEEMYGIMVSDIGDWCTQCGADMLFCAAFNNIDAARAESSSSAGNNKLSPGVAGVVGAVVTLIVAGILFALAMFFGGVRFHRVDKSRKGEMGGFKGGQKMASDRDLTIPKGGAVVGATVESPSSPHGGHERVGSWEMKGNEASLPDVGAVHPIERRPSFESDIGENPFRDPVRPDERV